MQRIARFIQDELQVEGPTFTQPVDRQNPLFVQENIYLATEDLATEGTVTDDSARGTLASHDGLTVTRRRLGEHSGKEEEAFEKECARVKVKLYKKEFMPASETRQVSSVNLAKPTRNKQKDDASRC